MTPPQPPRRPLMIYDGGCNFCRFWIARWRARTGPRIAYRRSQQVATRFPQISPAEFQSAVQLIEPGGAITSGADAVFRAFQLSGAHPWLARLAAKSGLFRTTARLAYRFIAKHRGFFSWWTRLLCRGAARRVSPVR